ncbi:MAG: hypothetical protein B6I36_08000 [Desulfobacteraceae bacterium 4572_35.1]|nr:MAG: hypothetical protein B6I36_08000 [Desulfobacteraceae bacterium 4572_35.1]
MTQHIKILPEKLCNQIAAGEVVERPASVIKELIENSLDAGADKIIVEVERGGKKKISVVDNGHGMGRDDIFLCFERHATSKITTEQDLFNLRYHGFRGEALPSIAAVSRLQVISRNVVDEVGTKLVVIGGKVIDHQQVGVGVGTSFEVKDLFFNLPARRKFLRRDETEFGHVAEVVTRLALAHPAVHFKLIHNGRTIIDLFRQNDHFDRIVAILGRSVVPDMIEVNQSDDQMSLSGYISRPSLTRSSTVGVYCFVNGRFIKDRVIHHALMDGYRQLLMKGRYPLCILFLQLDPEKVDVNVHPTKHEVRFHEQHKVHNFVSQVVRQQLRQLDVAKAKDFVLPDPATIDATTREKQLKTLFTDGSGSTSTGKNEIDVCGEHSDCIENGAKEKIEAPHYEDTTEVAETVSEYLSVAKITAETTSQCRKEESLPFEQAGYFSSLTVIGQYHHSYIVCEDTDGLVLIDQHAAHERIGFERLKTQFSLGAVEQQELLFPVVIELSLREDTELRQCLDQVKLLGFNLHHFGGKSWAVTALPVYVDTSDVKTMICDVLAEIGSVGVSRLSQDAFDAVLIKMACHGMIRANQKLEKVEMVALLQQLDEVDFNRNCPHGRPILQRYSLHDVEKMFRRL